MTVEVELSTAEFAHAMYAVTLRMVTSEQQGLNHATTYQRDWLTRVNEELVGVCGELAVAKARDVFALPPLNTFHTTPDIDRLEVRATSRENGCLILRDNDPDERWYVLVVGSPPAMRIAGSIRGGDGKQPQWLKDPNGHRPAWFVPQTQLVPPKHQ